MNKMINLQIITTSGYSRRERGEREGRRDAKSAREEKWN